MQKGCREAAPPTGRLLVLILDAAPIRKLVISAGNLKLLILYWLLNYSIKSGCKKERPLPCAWPGRSSQCAADVERFSRNFWCKIVPLKTLFRAGWANLLDWNRWIGETMRPVRKSAERFCHQVSIQKFRIKSFDSKFEFQTLRALMLRMRNIHRTALKKFGAHFSRAESFSPKSLLSATNGCGGLSAFSYQFKNEDLILMSV